jgi:hypothetical protein
MKINIQLEYPQEQIEFFAQSKNKVEDKDLGEFCQEYLTDILKSVIVQPFIDNIKAERYKEEQQIVKGMEDNAQAGITISVE